MIREIAKRSLLLRKCYGGYKRVKYSLYTEKKVEKLVFNYQRNRFRKYSGVYNDTQLKDISFLTWLYHVIEKGLAMPDMRLGFGYDKVLLLHDKILEFKAKYGVTPQLYDAVSTVLEYRRVHNEANYKLSDEVDRAIGDLCKEFKNIEPLNQFVYTREEYFNVSNLSFPDFIKSRHSVRNFAGTIQIKQLINAIEMAMTAPSACNRQPSRVHIITSKGLIQKCLAFQNGNRGFGELADKLLIVTGDLQTILGSQEFFDLNTNVGIFIMNLSYCLHYNKVAHCILNWYVYPENDVRLRNLVGLPNSETIVAFIVCGDVPEAFKVVRSPRVDAKQIYTIHS